MKRSTFIRLCCLALPLTWAGTARAGSGGVGGIDIIVKKKPSGKVHRMRIDKYALWKLPPMAKGDYTLLIPGDVIRQLTSGGEQLEIELGGAARTGKIDIRLAERGIDFALRTAGVVTGQVFAKAISTKGISGT